MGEAHDLAVDRRAGVADTGATPRMSGCADARGVQGRPGDEEVAVGQLADPLASFAQQPFDLRLLVLLLTVRTPRPRSSDPIRAGPRRPRRFVELDVADPDADAALGDAEVHACRSSRARSPNLARYPTATS